MQFFLTILSFIVSSAYILLLDHFAASTRSLQYAFMIILLTIFIISYLYYRYDRKIFTSKKSKFFFIFSGTVLIQLLILSTGDLSSPFFILIPLFMIALSFLFSFSIGLLFLVSCLIIIFVTLSPEGVLALLQEDPGSVLFQLVSLLVIIPLAYLASRQYHMKDTLAATLRARMKTTEAILGSIPELVIITDQDLRILSVNDAVTKTLQRSQAELLDRELFSVLLLKDDQGKLVTRNNLFPNNDMNPQNTNASFSLVTSSNLPKQIILSVQTVTQMENNLKQLSFIISFVNTNSQMSDTLDKARTKYEALVQNIKKQLLGSTLRTEVAFLEKIEEDTYAFQQLNNLNKQNITHVDIAQLCKQTLMRNQDFSQSLHVTTQFYLPNFGQKEIEHLTVKNYPVNPDQLTGPFFTASCDVKQIEFVSKKLLDIAVFLASGENDRQVSLQVTREEPQIIMITIRGKCLVLEQSSLSDLFVPYYGNLSAKTNLHLGSGLEGFLVKEITNALHIPFSCSYEKESSKIVFSIKIPQHVNS